MRRLFHRASLCFRVDICELLVHLSFSLWVLRKPFFCGLPEHYPASGRVDFGPRDPASRERRGGLVAVVVARNDAGLPYRPHHELIERAACRTSRAIHLLRVCNKIVTLLPVIGKLTYVLLRRRDQVAIFAGDVSAYRDYWIAAHVRHFRFLIGCRRLFQSKQCASE